VNQIWITNHETGWKKR